VTRLLVAAACCLLAAPGHAEMRWVSDSFTVPLRGGPSSSHRILHRGLPSGTPLEVLEPEPQNGFVNVRTEGGTEGWIEAHYLTAEPIARARLEAAERRAATLERQLADRARSVSELASRGQAATADREILAERVTDLEAELAELRSTSASAMATRAANIELEKLNARLRAEVDELAREIESLEESRDQRGMWLGGGLALGGLLLGALLKSRPRRSGWS
jgi:SH3 domain protein